MIFIQWELVNNKTKDHSTIEELYTSANTDVYKSELVKGLLIEVNF